MYNFLDFYDHVQWTQTKNRLAEQFLLEMPMRQQGDPDQYTKTASPYKSNTATDGYGSRIDPEDVGAKLSRQVSQDKWDQAVAEKPELKYYTLAANADKQEKKADQAAEKALGMGDRLRNRAGRVAGTQQTGKENYQAILQNNNTPAGQYALAIDSVLYKKRDVFNGLPLKAALEKLQSEVPAGGTEDIISHIQNLRAGFELLFNTAKGELFRKTQDGLVLAIKGGAVDFEDITSQNGGDLRLWSKIEELRDSLGSLAQDVYGQNGGDEEAVWFNPQVMKLVRSLHSATNQFIKSGRIGGKERAEVEGLHRDMQEILDRAQTHGA